MASSFTFIFSLCLSLFIFILWITSSVVEARCLPPERELSFSRISLCSLASTGHLKHGQEDGLGLSKPANLKRMQPGHV